MKSRYPALLIVPLFSTSALAAGYTGPGAEVVNTVVAAKNASNDTPVTLKGFVIKKLDNDDKYEFKDATGTITVEIDRDELPNIAFNDKTQVVLTGEVDKGLFQREIDVDLLEIVN